MTRALAALPALLAAGCLSLGAPPPPARYYVLSPGAAGATPEGARGLVLGAGAAGATTPEGARVLVLGLGPVRLPPYLDRAQIVTRAAPERLEVSATDRWAASLPVLFTRALADRLRRAIPAEVVEWPWQPGATPDLRLSLDVRRFEREADGTAVLEAGWTVHAGAGGAVLARGETRLREPATGADMTASVAALSRAMDRLATDAAAAVTARRAR